MVLRWPNSSQVLFRRRHDDHNPLLLIKCLIRIRAFSIVISICLKSMFRQFIEESNFRRTGTEIFSYTCYPTFYLESDVKWGMPSHGRCEKPQENTGNVERRWRIIFSANCMDLLMDVRSKCSTAELREDFLRKRKVTYCFFL